MPTGVRLRFGRRSKQVGVMQIEHPSIENVEVRDAGPLMIYRFKILDYQNEAAADYLLSILSDHIRFSLNSSPSDDVIQFRLHEGGYESMSGGHGYSGDWKPLDRENMIKKIKMVAQFNQGNHPRGLGSIDVKN